MNIAIYCNTFFDIAIYRNTFFGPQYPALYIVYASFAYMHTIQNVIFIMSDKFGLNSYKQCSQQEQRSWREATNFK